jgi:D-alanine-D-alanine ligase
VAQISYTVLILGGGDSAERDVSLDSARGMAEAVQELGYRVLAVDPARAEIEPTEDLSKIFGGAVIDEKPPDVMDDVFGARSAFVRTLTKYQEYGVDIVLNGLHGGVGEDGTIQAVLDYVGIPYTGSGAAACALAMDKYRAKRLAQAFGVPVPKDEFFNRAEMTDESITKQIRENLSFPVVVKPNTQGSSVGLTVVASIENLVGAVTRAFDLDDNILVEEYIAGSEITVAVLEGEGALPVLEIRPKSGLYDYFHKYQSGASEYLVPAPVDDGIAAAIRESAQRFFDLLGCRVYGRLDFRLGEDGRHYLLEANTLPGMTALSLVPKAAKAAGISYVELVSQILRLSLNK